MFTLFSLRKSEPFSREQRDYLLRMLDQYSTTEAGRWLRELGYQNFAFRWCPKMTVTDGVMGCFSPAVPGKIFLMPRDPDFPPENGRQYWIEQLFVTAVHELRHAWQWKIGKVAYVLCALPVMREFTLEKDAVQAQKKAELFVGKWTAKQDYLEAKARGFRVDEEDYLGGPNADRRP